MILGESLIFTKITLKKNGFHNTMRRDKENSCLERQRDTEDSYMKHKLRKQGRIL